MSGKEIYQKLHQKIDTLNCRVHWNDTFYKILKELYTGDEAELVAQMPSALTTLDELKVQFGKSEAQLRPTLDTLCRKGLVVDVFLNERYYYIPSPMVIGIFEFTMMRSGNDIDIKKIAKLFHQYMDDEGFYKLNFGKGQKMGLMRTLPYEESDFGDDYVEVLDYEKATAIVENANRYSIGTCSCRHEKLHAEKKNCDVPLDTCTSFGYSADYLIRNNLAREAYRSEMLENIARSKELGLILNSDNIRNKNQFICHCCKCCCNVLLGISKFGYPNTVVTSSYIATVKADKCSGCGLCIDACAVDAIAITSGSEGNKKVQVDKRSCIGCGICTTKCPKKGVVLEKRKKRVLHPESTFEHAILKHLDKGNLQDQLFPNPNRIDQKMLRGIVGGFLRLPPVKRALMGDLLRSQFLKLVEKGAKLQGKGWVTDI